MTVSAPPGPPRSSDPVDRDELEALVEALIEEARLRARRRRRRRSGLAAVGVGLILAAYVGFTSIAGPTAGGSLPANVPYATASTAGRSQLVFSAWANGRATIYRINPDGSDLHALTRGFSAAFPALAPDGREIAFTSTLRYHPIYVMNIDGGQQRLLARPGGAPSWSPDGTRIGFSSTYPPRSAGVYAIAASGGHARRLATRCPSDRESRSGPAWSPDRSTIVYSCAATMWMMNSDGTGAHMIARRWSLQPPAWSPDGTKIAFVSTGRGTRIVVMNADGSGLRRLPPHIYSKNGDCNVAWSPDGSRLAFSLGFRGGIYFMNADGTGVVRLDGVPTDACGVSWRALR